MLYTVRDSTKKTSLTGVVRHVGCLKQSLLRKLTLKMFLALSYQDSRFIAFHLSSSVLKKLESITVGVGK